VIDGHAASQNEPELVSLFERTDHDLVSNSPHFIDFIL
jgi:hypothetical protein